MRGRASEETIISHCAFMSLYSRENACITHACHRLPVDRIDPVLNRPLYNALLDPFPVKSRQILGLVPAVCILTLGNSVWCTRSMFISHAFVHFSMRFVKLHAVRISLDHNSRLRSLIFLFCCYGRISTWKRLHFPVWGAKSLKTV